MTWYMREYEDSSYTTSFNYDEFLEIKESREELESGIYTITTGMLDSSIYFNTVIVESNTVVYYGVYYFINYSGLLPPANWGGSFTNLGELSIMEIFGKAY